MPAHLPNTQKQLLTGLKALHFGLFLGLRSDVWVSILLIHIIPCPRLSVYVQTCWFSHLILLWFYVERGKSIWQIHRSEIVEIRNSVTLGRLFQTKTNKLWRATSSAVTVTYLNSVPLLHSSATTYSERQHEVTKRSLASSYWITDYGCVACKI